jgi:hypothetical protein
MLNSPKILRTYLQDRFAQKQPDDPGLWNDSDNASK